MFKRVAKRVRKKEKEDELGLDGEMKELLGLNDTDSDESSSSGSEDGSDEDEESRNRVMARRALGDADEIGEDQSRETEHAEEENGADSVDEDEEEQPAMSVSDALKNPLCLMPLQPDMTACVICPRKLLKNPVMIDVHLKSNAHMRRFARLREVAMDVDADTNVGDLVRTQFANPTERKPVENRLSKRAEKRKAKLADIRTRRAKQKVMKAKYKAKKEAQSMAAADATSHSETEDKRTGKPLPKRRRIGEDVGAVGDLPKVVASNSEAKPTTRSKQSDIPSLSKLAPPKDERVPKVKAVSKSRAAEAKKRRRSEPS